MCSVTQAAARVLAYTLAAATAATAVLRVAAAPPREVTAGTPVPACPRREEEGGRAESDGAGSARGAADRGADAAPSSVFAFAVFSEASFWRQGFESTMSFERLMFCLTDLLRVAYNQPVGIVSFQKDVAQLGLPMSLERCHTGLTDFAWECDVANKKALASCYSSLPDVRSSLFAPSRKT